ncbi:MAG TPA: DUF1353 domain-containing protein [Bacteroidia bacterium]|nr:DUF1353 domain-containing protein [Bacteroidia bacterium]
MMILLSSIEQPDLRPVSSRGARTLYRLRQAHCIEWIYGLDCWRVSIPEGFLCDGASCPRLLWSVTGIAPDGVHRMAALHHDFLYEHRGQLPEGTFERRPLGGGVWEPCQSAWSRKDADRLFCALLRESGIGFFRRRLMFLGVRLGGWIPWHIHPWAQRLWADFR